MKIDDINFNFARPGEIYFIREKDVITGEISKYTKIGLVGDRSNAPETLSTESSEVETSEDLTEVESPGQSDEEEAKTFADFQLRNSLARMKEHQTGNSGILLFDESNIPVVRTPAVAATEKAIHARFAHLRIRGEWFMLNSEELKEAIALAKALSALLEKEQKSFEKALELNNVFASGEIIKPDSEIIDFAQGQRKIERDLKIKQHRASFIENEIAKSMAHAIELEGVAGWTRRAGGKKFDNAKAKEVAPDLIEQSMVENTYKRFTLLGVEKVDSKNIDKVETKFIADNKSLLLTAPRPKDLQDLHQEYLSLLGEINELNWQRTLGRSFIKNRIGDATEIEGIAKWDRKVSNPTFNAAKFKELLKASGREADIALCMKPYDESFSFSVLKMRPYPTV
jgi:hypothetical protein